jgi:RND family efflux transporter MFP subunit
LSKTSCEKTGVSRMLQRAISGVMALFCLLAFPAACKEKPKSFRPPPPSVTVVRPVQRAVTDYIEATGNTDATNSVQLRARVAGYLEKVFFRDGEFVRKGQLLFLIQQSAYQANLRQAEAAILQQKAQLEYAGTQLARYTDLLSQKAAAQADVDNWRYQRDSAQANLDSALARRDLARLDLQYTEVRAPFDGRIDRTLVDVGNLVGSGEITVLSRISQIDPIYVYFNVSDSDLSRLSGRGGWRPSQSGKREIYVGFQGENGYPHRGHLDFASISLTPTSGTLLLRGVLTNTDGKILPGLYARMRVPLGERTAFLVPDQALRYDQRGPFLLAVNEKNVVQRTGVKAGRVMDHMQVIDEGLTGQEWIVTQGIQKAVPGRPVTPEMVTSKEAQ